MRYVDEFNDPELAKRLPEHIHATVTQPWAIMEVCGGQTHSIIRHGIDQLIPDQVEMIRGPGCPVCVTPLELIDRALEIASRPDVICCSFGDMLRVPGSGRDLFRIKAEGGDIRMVYSPLDALKLARQNPDREVVFFGIGFETTAPPNAMTVYQVARLGVRNFSMLVSHVLVPPAIEAIMSAPTCRVQGFLAAGHVCSVMGTAEYPPLVERFQGADGRQSGRAEVGNAYARAVATEGNPAARALLEDVFEVTDRAWRGIGMIPGSGWRLAPKYRGFDAEYRFSVGDIRTVEHPFVPAFGGDAGNLRHSAEISLGGVLAFSTDTYVVRPLFFPGGSTGHLAVNGTVNDLAMSGARSRAISRPVSCSRGARTSPSSAASRATWARPRRPPTSPWSPVTPRS